MKMKSEWRSLLGKLLVLSLVLSCVPFFGIGARAAHADAARDAYSRIVAGSADELNGTNIVASGNNLINIRPNNWAKYEGVDFGSEGAQDVVFYLAVPNAATGNFIEVRLDSPDGDLAGKLRLQGSADNYSKWVQEAVALPAAVTGVHDVYLVFVPATPGQFQFCNLGWFQFNTSYSLTDTMPPYTAATVAGQLEGTHYTSSVTVTFDVYDDYSGVASTVYSLDGGDSWSDVNGSVELRQEGMYELQYRSTDKAGNTEAAKSLSLTLQGLPSPSLFWTSTALRPGEIAMLIGEHLGTVTGLQLYRLPDDNIGQQAPGYVPHPQPDKPMSAVSGGEVADPAWDDSEAVSVPLLQQTDQSLKFIVPATEAAGIYAIKATASGADMPVVYLNAPDLVWVQGDQGPSGSPGGWLRLNGHNLAVPGKTPQIALEASDGQMTYLAAEQAIDEYSVQVQLPDTLASGDYTVYLHNGLGGATAWSNPASIHIEPAAVWPQTVFNVKDYGAKGDNVTNDTAAVLDALRAAKQAGGGVVYLPRGRYQLTHEIEIPPFTTVRGESKELTQVFWTPFQWDVGELPYALIKGAHDFAIEDISFRATRAGNFLVSDTRTPESGNVLIRRVRVEANPFAGHDDINKEGLINGEIWAKRSSDVDTVKLGGRNIQIVDSLFSGPSRSLVLVNAEGAYIKGNTFYNGKYGWYSIGGPDRLLFEDNQIIGADLTSTGGALGKPIDHYTQNMYFARNTYKNTVGNDREALTNDGGSGAYIGKVGSVDGMTVTLPEGGKDATWAAHTWGGGGGLFILSGTGAGQVRRIVDHTKDTIQLDSPFEVEPDETSILSITALQIDGIFADNSFENTGAFQFYGQAADMTVSGNTFKQASGFNAWGRFVYGGNQPDWYIDVKGNTVADANYYHMYGVNDNGGSGSSSLKVVSQGDYTLQIGATVRDNLLKENGMLIIQGGTPQNSIRDAVVSGNRFEHSMDGMRISGNVNGVVLYGNMFDDVDREISIPQALLDAGKVTVVAGGPATTPDDPGDQEDPGNPGEPGDPQTIAGMTQTIADFAADGDLNAAVSTNLSVRLTTIQALLATGDYGTAVAYMEDLQAYVNDPSVQQQGLLSEAATAAINAMAEELIGQWNDEA